MESESSVSSFVSSIASDDSDGGLPASSTAATELMRSAQAMQVLQTAYDQRNEQCRSFEARITASEQALAALRQKAAALVQKLRAEQSERQKWEKKAATLSVENDTLLARVARLQEELSAAHAATKAEATSAASLRSRNVDMQEQLALIASGATHRPQPSIAAPPIDAAQYSPAVAAATTAAELRISALQAERDSAAAVLATEREARISAENTVSELRGTLRIREMELARSLAGEKEACTSAETSRLNALCLSEKLDILRSEFYDVRTAAAQQQAKYEADVSRLADRLCLFETLEKQADSLIASHAAALPQNADASAIDSAASEIACALKDIPVSHQKRLAELLKYAQRVAEAEGKLRSAEEHSASIERKLLKEMNSVKELSERCELLSGPASGLVRALDDTSSSLAHAKELNIALNSQLEKMRPLYAASQQRVMMLEADVKQLMNAAATLGPLRGALGALRDALRADPQLIHVLPPSVVKSVVFSARGSSNKVQQQNFLL